MRILMVSSECAPFSKTGGLGDVSGALPPALNALGHQADILTPLYRDVSRKGYALEDTGVLLHVPLGDGHVHCRLIEASIAGRAPDTGTRVFFLHAPAFYDRDGYYNSGRGDWADNCARFALLSRAALELADVARPTYDIIHANDWMTGLVPAYLRTYYAGSLATTGTVFSIHNMAYQGRFGWDDFLATQLPWELWNWRSVEDRGTLCTLKAGIIMADRVSTVSRTYAEECKHTEWGFGLQEAARSRGDEFRGIVNGVDYALWNPETDDKIPANYSAGDLSGKAACKAFVQRALGLSLEPEIPLCVAIGRLTPQKGWGILIDAIDGIVGKNCQLAVLGSGDPGYSRALGRAAGRWPGRVGGSIGFDETQAHRLEAAADIFLMPSRYEPCGLNQLYSLRYGAVPLVHRTGGLADTVVDADDWTLEHGLATGFTFGDFSVDGLLAALQRAVHIYGGDPPLWRRIQETGMRQDWSWNRSAREYLALYHEAQAAACLRNGVPV